MDAQLQQEIKDAALDFWIEWNYCAEHAWSYLGSDAWLDDDDEGSENNKQYKSIIDEKVEAAMTEGAICDEDDPRFEEVEAKAEKQYNEGDGLDDLRGYIATLLTYNLISKDALIEHIKAFGTE